MKDSKVFIYVTEQVSKKVVTLRWDSETGALTKLQELPVNGKAMPMAVSPDNRHLYVALRSKPYAIVNFAINQETGTLTELGYTPAAESTVNMAIDKTGRFLLGAVNPSSGGGDTHDSRRTGMLSVTPIGDRGCAHVPYQTFRTPPKLHCVMPDPTNRYIFGAACDGDAMLRYDFDAVTGICNPDSMAQVLAQRKAGPRHFKFHPNNRFMYLVNEYDASVYTYAYDVRNGQLTEIQMSTAVPPDYKGDKNVRAADVHLTPDGRWLYVSVRSSLTMAVYAVDPITGMLTPKGHFPTLDEPRSFAIDPFGRFLVATGLEVKSLITFSIDRETGALKKLAETPMGDGPNWIEVVRLA